MCLLNMRTFLLECDLPSPLSAAKRASAGLLYCLGSLKALLLENVPNERIQGRQDYVEESGRA